MAKKSAGDGHKYENSASAGEGFEADVHTNPEGSPESNSYGAKGEKGAWSISGNSGEPIGSYDKE